MFSRTNLIIAFVVLVVAGLTYLYFTRKPKPKAVEGESVCEVFFFYTDWCPYCKAARPEWDKFKGPLKNTVRDGYQLMFTEVNADTNEALANKYKVDGYPTIKCVKDGKVTDYDARPSVATLNQFLDSCFE